MFFIHIDRHDYPIHAEWLGMTSAVGCAEFSVGTVSISQKRRQNTVKSKTQIFEWNPAKASRISGRIRFRFEETATVLATFGDHIS